MWSLIEFIPNLGDILNHRGNRNMVYFDGEDQQVGAF